MSDRRLDELIARLSRSDPAARLDFDSPQWRARKEATFARVVAHPRRRLLQRRGVLGVVIAALAIGGAAASYQLTRPVTDPTSVGCYRSASLAGTVAVAAPSSSPVAACEALWSAHGGGPAPTDPFVTCVDSSGGALVFPSRDDDLCASLGLATPSSSEPTTTERVVALAAALDRDEEAQACWDPGLASREIAAELRALGLSGWTTTTTGAYTEAQPCASVFVDTSDDVIDVSPVIALEHR